jgi:tetrapyrrole methylase family protein / MazG family protein
VPRVVVAGLGPAGPDLMTAGVRDAIASAPKRFLRTTRHPSASVAEPAESFDKVYDRAPSIEAVYASIVERLVEAATAGDVLYAVPGSPLVAELTVELLLADDRVDVEVLPALSFIDLAWARLGVDPVAAGVRLVDGHEFAVSAAGERGPLLVAQCDSKNVLSDIKLAVEDGGTATVLQRLGLPDESVVTVAWDELDRSVEPDHLTALYIPALATPVAAELVRFDELVRTLRARCPWDREQTHRSLIPYLLEESHEVLEAIEAGDADHLEEELGDLLYQVFFHATLAAEEGAFTIADVARGIHDKLYVRHPHVFGDAEAATAEDVKANWERAKTAEKGRASVMDGIPGGLPALLYARKVQSKARSVGFDWSSADDVYPKVLEELDEVRADPSEEELGDLLFAVVNLARHLGVDAETALRAATAKFRNRFRAVEELARQRHLDLHDLDLAGLDALWDEIKRTTRS